MALLGGASLAVLGCAREGGEARLLYSLRTHPTASWPPSFRGRGGAASQPEAKTIAGDHDSPSRERLASLLQQQSLPFGRGITNVRQDQPLAPCQGCHLTGFCRSRMPRRSALDRQAILTGQLRGFVNQQTRTAGRLRKSRRWARIAGIGKCDIADPYLNAESVDQVLYREKPQRRFALQGDRLLEWLAFPPAQSPAYVV